MKTAYTRRLVISSIVLSLAFGGGTIYAAKRVVLAESGAAVQTSTNNQSSDSSKLAKHEGKGFPLLEEAATILGTDQQSLEKSLQSGKSIVDVAKEIGISEAELTSKLRGLRETRIQEAVKNGKLDAARAEVMKQRMDEHLKFMINEKGLHSRKDHHFKGSSSLLNPDFEKIAEALGMTRDALKTELKSGKSLAEIAAAKGMSKAKLMDTIKVQLTPTIEQMVDRKNTSMH
jgi:transposase-like protein